MKKGESFFRRRKRLNPGTISEGHKYLRNYQCKCIKSQLKTSPVQMRSVQCLKLISWEKKNCHRETLISTSKRPPSPSPSLTEPTPAFRGNVFKCAARSLASPQSTPKAALLRSAVSALPRDSALGAPHPPGGVFFKIRIKFRNSGTSGTYSAFIYAAQETIHLSTESSFNQTRIFSIKKRNN